MKGVSCLKFYYWLGISHEETVNSRNDDEMASGLPNTTEEDARSQITQHQKYSMAMAIAWSTEKIEYFP